MVLNRALSGATDTRRIVGFTAAYSLVLVTGTALLIAVFGSFDTGRSTDDGHTISAADVVMLQSREGALQQADPVLLASRNSPNDKRGL